MLQNGFGHQSSNQSVPLEVLDKFLKISKENNESYSAMVAAVDAMSAKLMDVGDQIAGLTGTIEEEQLADVLNNAVVSIQKDVETLRNMMGTLTEPKYNILKGISEQLASKKPTDKELMDVSESVVWVVNLFTVVRRNAGKLIFLAGVMLAVVLGSSTMNVWDIIKLVFK